MQYTLKKRVINGKDTVGYEVIGDDLKIMHFSKADVCNLASQGLITNATYNKSNRGLSGIHYDLRSLPSMNLKELQKKEPETKEITVKSNAQTSEFELQLIANAGGAILVDFPDINVHLLFTKDGKRLIEHPYVYDKWGWFNPAEHNSDMLKQVGVIKMDPDTFFSKYHNKGLYVSKYNEYCDEIDAVTLSSMVDGTPMSKRNISYELAKLINKFVKISFKRH